jgi:hypothetical protein
MRNRFAMLFVLAILTACQNTPKPPTDSELTASVKSDSIWLVVPQKGDMTLFGKKIALEQIKQILQDTLVKMASIPDEIPIQYEGEVLMGMRGAILDEVNDGIKAAKAQVQDPVLEVLRKPIEKELGLPIQFAVGEFKKVQNFAFVIAGPVQKNGDPIDYAKTPFKSAVENGVFDPGIFALLKLENKTWKVVTYTQGATDVPYVCWWKEFNAPKELFNPEVIAADCQ